MADEKRVETLAEECNELLRKIGGLAKAQDSDWLALDIGMGQFKAMVVLKEQGRQTGGGLARILKTSEPSTSLLVDKLVIRGFVERGTDPDDRRRTILTLSAEGEQLMTRLQRTLEDHFVGELSRLGEKDLEALLQGLTALYGVIEPRGDGDQG